MLSKPQWLNKKEEYTTVPTASDKFSAEDATHEHNNNDHLAPRTIHAVDTSVLL